MLDVGSGPGALTAVLAERRGASAVTAIDPKPGFVAELALRVPGVDARVGFRERPRSALRVSRARIGRDRPRPRGGAARHRPGRPRPPAARRGMPRRRRGRTVGHGGLRRRRRVVGGCTRSASARRRTPSTAWTTRRSGGSARPRATASVADRWRSPAPRGPHEVSRPEPHEVSRPEPRRERPAPEPRQAHDAASRAFSTATSKSAAGHCGSISSSASSSSACTASRAYHLRSAGTTNQGASGVEVRSKTVW